MGCRLTNICGKPQRDTSPSGFLPGWVRVQDLLEPVARFLDAIDGFAHVDEAGLYGSDLKWVIAVESTR